MELNLPALSPTCHVSGESFVDDERVVSFLVRHDTGDVVRYDVKPGVEEQFQPPGRVACRWVQRYKTRVAGENPERELKLTAETLFLTLAEPGNELTPENTRLVQFLALMLERKRVLKPRGVSPDGTKNIFEHSKSKQRYEVPAGELDPAFFVSVQEQLSVLVGEPKSKSSSATAEKVTSAAPAPSAASNVAETPSTPSEASTPAPAAEPTPAPSTGDARTTDAPVASGEPPSPESPAER